MKTIYAIRDRVADEFVGLSMYMLFVFRTDQQAVRYFADAINDPTSVLNKHPSDYELVSLGLVGDRLIKSSDKSVTIITGDALIAAQPLQLSKEA